MIVDAELTAATGYAERDTASRAARSTPHLEATTHRRRGQGLRHEGLCWSHPPARVHPARRPKHHQPALGDRWSHHPSPRASRQPADPQTNRGTLRLDQDDRWRTKASLPRPSPQPGLVQDHHRRLQPATHHRPRRRLHLTAPIAERQRPDPPNQHPKYRNLTADRCRQIRHFQPAAPQSHFSAPC